MTTDRCMTNASSELFGIKILALKSDLMGRFFDLREEAEISVSLTISAAIHSQSHQELHTVRQ